MSQVQSFFFTIGIKAAILVVLGCLPRNICSRVESIVFSSGNETMTFKIQTNSLQKCLKFKTVGGVNISMGRIAGSPIF